MTLAWTSADFAPNWWLLAVVFVVCFLGPIWMLFRAADRNKPASRAELAARLRRADHDAIVAAERERARRAYTVD